MKKKFISLSKTVGFLILLLSFTNLPLVLFNINTDNWNSTIKVIYMLGMDLIFMTILFFAYKDILVKDFKRFKEHLTDNLEYAFKWWLIGFIIMAISNVIMVVFSGYEVATNEQNLRTAFNSYPLYMAFSVMFYAPFTEELIFRKGFRDLFETKYLYIIMSGITFAFLHVITSLTVVTDLFYIIPYSALGVVFAWLYHKTDNIFFSMSMHLLHNTLAIVLYFVGGII